MPIADVVCGVDIGTTHIKAVLVAEHGSVASVARLPTPVISDGYGDCHDPEQIRSAAEQVMRQAQGSLSAPTRIVGIGVTSVGEEGVPLGPHGELLYPSIAWYERRGSDAERNWSTRHPDDDLFAVTGLHKDLGFTVFKWLWLKSAQPSVWAQCTAWLGIADYVIWRWTGQRGMSIGHASRTAVLDLKALAWQEEWAAEALTRGAAALPELHDAGSPVGVLRSGRIAGLVTADEVPVVATGLDHVVGAYAAGVVRPGRVLDSMGTAEALVEPVLPPHLDAARAATAIDYGAGILPHTHLAIVGLGSGAGVSGVLDALGGGSPGSANDLESRALDLEPGAGGLVYVPPRARSSTGGALFGHQVTHDAAHLYRAVLEGWALAADAALSALGGRDRLPDIMCIGGGTASALWMQVKASILGREIHYVQTPEIVAVGAALLASKAVPAVVDLSDWKPASRAVAPVRDWVPRYRALREEFRTRAAMVHPDAVAGVYP